MAETTDASRSPNPPTPAKLPAGKAWLENILSLAFALLLVFMIRSSVVEAFKIPSGSMIPTLFVGDHIFVNKFAYGFKLPFSDLFSDDPIFLLKRDAPKRGDIVVFLFPQNKSIYYIKRVVGVPGDSIEIKEKTLFINGKKVEQIPMAQEEADGIVKQLEEGQLGRSQLQLFREKLRDSPQDSAAPGHMMMLDKNHYLEEDFGTIQVPADHLFVMGDNRDFSNDSRFWGFVPMNLVKGKAMVIWLSLWLDFGKSEYHFRPSRIGTVLN